MGKKRVAIANYNSYEQIVVSYDLNCFDQLLENVEIKGGRVIPLKVNRPFHHSMMRSAADVYITDLRKEKFQVPNNDIFLNVTGEKYNEDHSLLDKLYEQIFMPVRWIKTIENMLSKGTNVFYEISPKPTLGRFINNISNGQAIVLDIQKSLLYILENA